MTRRRGRSRVYASSLMPITVRGRVAVATRTRSRRSGAKSQSADLSSELRPNGRSVSPTCTDTHGRTTRAVTAAGAHGGVGRAAWKAIAGV